MTHTPAEYARNLGSGEEVAGRLAAQSAPPVVEWIVRTLEEAGFEAWAVGGAVRDMALGVDVVDWDFATRARPKEVRRLFKRTVPVGIEHGTVGVLAKDGRLHEVTTFRRDVETFGRKAVVEFADSIDEDLSRRDFTINAVAWHPMRRELHDPFGGLGDLKAGLLRTVGNPADRFREDYLRVLRALRFAGRFEMEVDPTTWTAIGEAVGQLTALSRERVREELMKVLGGFNPHIALQLYARSGALAVLFPELDQLRRHPADADEAQESGTLWDIALHSMEFLPPSRPRIRLATLLMDVGAPPTIKGQMAEPTDSDVTEGVRERGGRRAAALLTRIRASNSEVDTVSGIVSIGPELPSPDADGATRRRWLAAADGLSVPDLIRVAAARARETEARVGARAVADVAKGARALRAELQSKPCVRVKQLALSGRDLIALGMRPGPHFGDLLDGLLERVLEDPTLNNRATLTAIVQREVEDG